MNMIIKTTTKIIIAIEILASGFDEVIPAFLSEWVRPLPSISYKGINSLSIFYKGSTNGF